jgi:hypothetical protein
MKIDNNGMNEAFENDTKWGDSLLGRLINSGIRKTGIVSNQVKIEPLLTKFKEELDILISSSLKTDTRSKLIELQIKEKISTIGKICLSSEIKDIKLDKLVGDSNDGILYNLVEFIDKIDSTEKVHIKDIDIVKVSNSLSSFINELTKIKKDGKQSNFVPNFTNLASTLSTINASLNTFKGFSINEDLEVGHEYKTKNGKIVRILSTTNSIGLGGDGKYLTSDDNVNEPLDKDSVFVQYKDKNGKYPEKSTMSVLALKKSNIIQTIESPKSDKISKIKELSKKCLDKDLKTEDSIKSDSDYIDLINTFKELDENDYNYIKTKNPGDTVDIDDKPTDVENAIKLFTPKEETVESTSEVLRFPLFTKLNEVNEPDLVTVESLFNSFKNEINIKDITKEEFSELEKNIQGESESGSEKLSIDLSKNADPIIAICRIFRRAHDLYFTPIIPSGRTDNKVSNKTLREYIWAGSSGSGPSNNSYGAWVVKSIFDKWVDGVLKILQDQSYRKILANIRFIVPGSEDTFNKESLVFLFKDYQRILESDELQKGQSHGKILFDFINDMLDVKSSAEFDTKQRSLLNKYFGNIELPKGNKNNSPIVNIKPNKEDIEAKCLKWNIYTSPLLKGCLDSKYEGPFFAIPIKSNNPSHEFIFLHLLKKIKIVVNGGTSNYYITKFSFDKQIIVNDMKGIDFKDYKISDWSTQTDTPKNIYYGLVKENISNNKLDITYANVNGGVIGKDIYNVNYQISPSQKKINNIEVNTYVSTLFKYDENKNESEIKSDFNKNVLSEKPKHQENLDLIKDGKTLLELLTDKVKSSQTTK